MAHGRRGTDLSLRRGQGGLEAKGKAGVGSCRVETSRAGPPPAACGLVGLGAFFSLFLFGSAASLSSLLPAQPDYWLQEACYTAYKDAPLLVQRITVGLTVVFKTTQLNI